MPEGPGSPRSPGSPGKPWGPGKPAGPGGPGGPCASSITTITTTSLQLVTANRKLSLKNEFDVGHSSSRTALLRQDPLSLKVSRTWGAAAACRIPSLMKVPVSGLTAEPLSPGGPCGQMVSQDAGTTMDGDGFLAGTFYGQSDTGREHRADSTRRTATHCYALQRTAIRTGISSHVSLSGR